MHKAKTGGSGMSKAASIATDVSKAFQFTAVFFQLLKSIVVSRTFQFAAVFFQLPASLNVSKVFQCAAGFF